MGRKWIKIQSIALCASLFMSCYASHAPTKFGPGGEGDDGFTIAPSLDSTTFTVEFNIMLRSPLLHRLNLSGFESFFHGNQMVATQIKNSTEILQALPVSSGNGLPATNPLTSEEHGVEESASVAGLKLNPVKVIYQFDLPNSNEIDTANARITLSLYKIVQGALAPVGTREFTLTLRRTLGRIIPGFCSKSQLRDLALERFQYALEDESSQVQDSRWQEITGVFGEELSNPIVTVPYRDDIDGGKDKPQNLGVEFILVPFYNYESGDLSNLSDYDWIARYLTQYDESKPLTGQSYTYVYRHRGSLGGSSSVVQALPEFPLIGNSKRKNVVIGDHIAQAVVEYIDSKILKMINNDPTKIKTMSEALSRSNLIRACEALSATATPTTPWSYDIQTSTVSAPISF